MSSLLVVCLFLMMCFASACIFESGPSIVLNKKSVSYVPICIVLNDQTVMVSQVKFDVLTRIVMQGSFSQVTAPNACSSNTRWFSKGCNWNSAGSYGDGLGNGAPTNFYASVQGISSIYRKRYAYISGTQISAVFPIVTLVIQVNNGKVTQVYWDDDCYFNEGFGASPSQYPMLNCKFNAYDLFTNSGNSTFQTYLNPKGTMSSTIGFDCTVTNPACTTSVFGGGGSSSGETSSPSSTPTQKNALPAGFCDLGIYVVWVGTSADGQQLGSAGKRYKRFRQYAMANQYFTMLNSSGNSLPITS